MNSEQKKHLRDRLQTVDRLSWDRHLPEAKLSQMPARVRRAIKQKKVAERVLGNFRKQRTRAFARQWAPVSKLLKAANVELMFGTAEKALSLTNRVEALAKKVVR